MTWWCCPVIRKKHFLFENGTVVKATDPFRAIDLLKSISLKNYTEIRDGKMWFHPNVSVTIDPRDLARARRTAEWALYLDRRDPKEPVQVRVT